MRVITVLVAIALAVATPAIADKGGNPHGGGGGGGNGTSGGGTNGGGNGSNGTAQSSLVTDLALVSEYVNYSANPAAPTWCLNEDDYDQRFFSGSLYGSYSTSYQLCDGNTDYSGGMYWTAGGEGLETDVSVVGSLADLTITAPDGSAHHAVLTGESSSKGVTSYQYTACYVPPYSVSTNQGTDPLAGGTWTIILSGQISQANWTTTVRMTDAPFQQSHCPASEQNLLP
jgi:hypothetical protein